MSDKEYLLRCTELARLGGKNARPNPMVGAMVVYKDRIIGEGYHETYGKSHAEVNAVNSVKEEDKQYLSQSTIYVSLEPCCHYGITPPCTNMIIRNKIPRVCIAEIDPSQKVNKKGIKQLEQSGIQVDVIPILDDDTIAEFKVNQLQQRPLVQLKMAKSKDNFIGQKDKQVWLSNATSSIFTHKLRAYTDAILIGTNTALTDNPSLTLRNYPGKAPQRIVLDRTGKIPESHTLLADTLPTIIFTENKRKLNAPHKQQIEFDFSEQDFCQRLLMELFKMDISHLMVEGGPTLHKSFLKEGLWDEAVVIQTQKVLHEGIKAVNISGKLKTKYDLGEDQVFVISNPN